MSPSFPSEGKTVLVWVKVLPFLCLLQIFQSPWELSVDHTLLKNSGSFWSGKLLNFRHTQELHSKQRWAEQALPWVPNALRGQGGHSLGTSLQPAEQHQRANLLPGLSAPPISATKHSLLPNTFTPPPATSCSSQDCSHPTGIPRSRSPLPRMVLHAWSQQLKENL